MTRLVLWTVCTTAALVVAAPAPMQACAVCFGDPNSTMAIGASWGVLLLVGVTAAVLSAFAGFFLYLVKRSRMALGQSADLSRSSQASGSM
ncbi:MAG: hypothetical protein O3A25_13085 [Acidobacteria bacterium]|nr:hypothetical protein [Acidobacteriota bacterium]